MMRITGPLLLLWTSVLGACSSPEPVCELNIIYEGWSTPVAVSECVVDRAESTITLERANGSGGTAMLFDVNLVGDLALGAQSATITFWDDDLGLSFYDDFYCAAALTELEFEDWTVNDRVTLEGAAACSDVGPTFTFSIYTKVRD